MKNARKTKPVEGWACAKCISRDGGGPIVGRTRDELQKLHAAAGFHVDATPVRVRVIPVPKGVRRARR